MRLTYFMKIQEDNQSGKLFKNHFSFFASISRIIFKSCIASSKIIFYIILTGTKGNIALLISCLKAPLVILPQPISRRELSAALLAEINLEPDLPLCMFVSTCAEW